MSPVEPLPGEAPEPVKRRSTQQQSLGVCNRCRATWAALGAAHCGGCCRMFSTARHFDLHRSARGDHGTCLDPATIINARGERLLFHRNGMWRGPVISEEQKARAGWGVES